MQFRLRDNVDTITTISPYPAAGKGTLITPLKLALAKQGLVGHMEVGEIIRSHKKEGTLIGEAAAEFEALGEMVPDKVIVPEIRRNIRALDPNAVFLLDGFPRISSQIPEYQQLMEQLGRTDKFVYLNVPREVAECRMIQRGELARARR